ncbi:c-type cytochrome [Ruegeria marina]|uniref:Sulfur dehydrogenase subunit SoxD n=1 Tax=Ruegeria marina TaxID=639004 RepID=A0A1G6RZG1_9RHOB|nr:c-type cytochrome [Ruegeria marina]SDD10050.1 sulfur dehydrogenase subunit SoxD [Ruegeria marina]
MSKFPKLTLTASLAALMLAAPVSAGNYGLGRPALPEEIAAWDLDVSPDGTGLPAGSGSVEDGEAIFADYCAICHGDFAEGVDNWPKLAGGEGTLDREDPLKTVGSYWPYLTTTWDYVNRSMPFGNAQTLTPNEVYAIVAYILYSNDLVDDDFVLSNENLLDVELPNAEGFILDDRETAEAHFWTNEPCMSDCKDSVEITMRAMVLDVTPEETRAKKVQELIRRTKPEPSREEVKAPAEAAEQPAAETASASAVDPELVAAGESVFKKCKACHQVGADAKNKTGPLLNGIVGAPAGHVDGFKYSKAMQEAAEGGLVWSDAELAAFLTKPKDYMKGTKMSFAGLKKDEEIEAVIAYLKSFE